MEDRQKRAEEARKAAYQIGVAKTALMDALKIAQSENLRWIASLDKLCAKVEIAHRRFNEQGR